LGDDQAPVDLVVERRFRDLARLGGPVLLGGRLDRGFGGQPAQPLVRLPLPGEKGGLSEISQRAVVPLRTEKRRPHRVLVEIPVQKILYQCHNARLYPRDWQSSRKKQVAKRSS